MESLEEDEFESGKLSSSLPSTASLRDLGALAALILPFVGAGLLMHPSGLFIQVVTLGIFVLGWPLGFYCRQRHAASIRQYSGSLISWEQLVFVCTSLGLTVFVAEALHRLSSPAAVAHDFGVGLAHTAASQSSEEETSLRDFACSGVGGFRPEDYEVGGVCEKTPEAAEQHACFRLCEGIFLRTENKAMYRRRLHLRACIKSCRHALAETVTQKALNVKTGICALPPLEGLPTKKPRTRWTPGQLSTFL
mmetsp:Transcript_12999/g.21154  ORF Transcript_12999/g.21154 Transcript_12999/m.21154 type:complete len:250 (+) Transcript_12999:34-783(+)